MKVVVAMSGGVDSSVAAGLLVEQGHEVVGVHMKLHDAPSTGATKTCCGLDDALDARRVADRLGIPFYVLNLKEAFQKAVIDDLVESYATGATPSQAGFGLAPSGARRKTPFEATVMISTPSIGSLSPGPTTVRLPRLNSS